MSTDNIFFKTVFDTIAEGVIIRNAQGEIVEFNEQVTKISRLSKEQIKGEVPLPSGWRRITTDGDTFQEDDLPGIITLRTGIPQNNVIMGIDLGEGELIWIRLNSRPFKINDELFVISTFLDITEKHKLDQDLKKSEERWHLALEGSELGVWDWDTQSQDLYFSDYWKGLLGYSPGEVENKLEAWQNAIHPDDRPRVFAEIEKHLNGTTPGYHIEHRLLCKDGNYRWLLTSGKALVRSPEGIPLRLVGTIRDIHATKVFQEALRITESTFSSAFHFSTIGIALVDPSGSWQDVNPALLQMLGYSRAELLSLTFQDITHPDDLAADMGFVQQMLNKEIDNYQLEKRYILKNGHYIWALLSVSLVWENNEPQYFISQIVDISKTKELISELEWKNDSLNTLSLDLEHKIGQLEEFNRIVAHNLRGPAGNIKMLLDVLPDSCPDVAHVPYYDMLRDTSSNLLSTLDELMKIVEVRLNKNIQFENCNVQDIINSHYVNFKAQIKERNIIVEEDLEEPEISYPKVYLESILYNLISNAIKYSRTDVQPHIQIKTRREKGRMVLQVKDNGLGIDLEKYGNQVFKLKKIFHKGYDSKGVGLFIIKNQIETFGGQITLISKPFVGSEFTVTF
ncbi:PAS domain S-box protein [Adhaeribacter aquaticus]|uniref:PAS domain S-box protein n=1 Tax=Adhaeribacter aquaticus TaxID=299567 RepID=UPI0004116192|nr:PAS domain S-box protein [Adhaeribacter aquaticus]